MLAHSLIIVLVAYFSIFTMATLSAPPACLLTAASSSSDLKSLCTSKDVTSKIAKTCGAEVQEALSAFADMCNGVGSSSNTTASAITTSGQASVGTLLPSSSARGNWTTLPTVTPTAAGGPVTTLGVGASGASAAASAKATAAAAAAAAARGRLDGGVFAALAGLAVVVVAL